jgi:hypothetical protein
MLPLHASEARALQRCPREWSFAYQQRRVPIVRPESLTRGSSVHRWLNAWWKLGGRDELGFQSIPSELPSDPIARACCLGYAARYELPHLQDVEVELPFTATIGGVKCAGTVDALGWKSIPEDNAMRHASEMVIVEHKTTSSDISPGSLYWRQVSQTDLQVSLYAAAFPGATILYDVVRKPDFERSQVPLCDDQGSPIVLDGAGLRVRKTTGDKGWRRTGDKERGYILQTRPETDDELVARCLEAMSNEPDKYFQRQVIVRLEHEHALFEADVSSIDKLRWQFSLVDHSAIRPPRNPASCHAFNRPCGYFEVCWGSESIDNDGVFEHNAHGEEVDGETFATGNVGDGP